MEFLSKSFSELTTTELYELLKSRMEVFLLEQGIVCLDLDGVDYVSTHFFLKDGERVIAYLRAYSTESGVLRLGRVLTLIRGKGHGRLLMEKTISDIRKNSSYKKISLHAQKHAKEFYEKFGFEVTSDDFLEEGVVHVAMELDLN